MMGGDISIKSEPGKGTKVIVTLEHRIAAEDDLPSEEAEKEMPAFPDGLSGRRILLAEDNELNSEIAQELLVDCKINN